MILIIIIMMDFTFAGTNQGVAEKTTLSSCQDAITDSHNATLEVIDPVILTR